MSDRYFDADETLALSSIELTALANCLPSKGRETQRSAGPAAGRRSGSRRWQPGEGFRQLDLGSTLGAGARRQASTVGPSDGLDLKPTDLHLQRQSHQARRLMIFVVDTSDSMGDGPEVRMKGALGALLSLAGTAYLNRDQVCLITFRERSAEVVVPPTGSVMRIRQLLQRLPVGGATPLAAGLKKALHVARQARSKSPWLNPLMVLVSDGEATVSLKAGADPQRECLELAEELKREGFLACIIDTHSGQRRSGLMQRLAQALGSDCHHLHALRAAQVISLVRHSTSQEKQ